MNLRGNGFFGSPEEILVEVFVVIDEGRLPRIT